MVLRVFVADRDGPALQVADGDPNKFLHLDPKDEDDKADLLGMTQLSDLRHRLAQRSGSVGIVQFIIV